MKKIAQIAGWIIFFLALLFCLCFIMVRIDENLSRHASVSREPFEQSIPSPLPKEGRF